MSDNPQKIRFFGAAGLSGRLLALTIIFVMIGEFFIFVPSLMNFRDNWLKEKLAKAQIATLVLEATPDAMINEQLEKELLTHVGASIVALKRGEMKQLILKSPANGRMIKSAYDLRDEGVMQKFTAVFEGLFANQDRLIKVRGGTRFNAGDFVEIVIEERMMREAMWQFGRNILFLSVVLSLFIASMIYVVLHWLMVRPIKRITQSFVDFGMDPNRNANKIVPSNRSDELGIAEKQLLSMQEELQSTLKEKNRLAALGLAVSKISHDLRNMLSSTQMISDRLQHVDDPMVQKLSPKLEAALDRAINFCVRTLKYGQAKEEVPNPSHFALQNLMSDVTDSLALENVKNVDDRSIRLRAHFLEGQMIYADRHQLYRVVLNISRNSAEILKLFPQDDGEDPQIWIEYFETEDRQHLVIADNGPGVSETARKSLFDAFKGSVRPGGTGLGLAISHELVTAHHGELELMDDADALLVKFKDTEFIHHFDELKHGAIFVISLPKAI